MADTVGAVETATIDLGELPRGEPVQVEAPWPVRERLRRLRPQHLRWAATAIGLVALMLSTTGAATGKPRPALVPFVAATSASWAIDQQHLYVLEEPTGPVHTRLTAYALTDGAVRWQRTLSATEGTWLDTTGGLLLVTSETSGEGLTQDWTTRLDPETGRQLWQRPGTPVHTPAQQEGDLLLLRRPLPADLASYEWPARNELAAVSLGTGARVWTRAVTGWPSYVPGNPDRLLTLDPAGGRLELFDFQTGALARSARISVPEAAEVLVAGPVAFVFDPNLNDEFVGYDLANMSPSWTLEADQGTWVSVCGRLVCASGNGPVRAFDPVTGETVWSAGWLPEHRLGGLFDVYDLGSTPLDGYLQLTETSSDGLLRGRWLVDAASGELVLDLQRWVIAASAQWGRPPEEPMAIWHEHGVAWVGSLRPDLSGIDPIGSIEVPDQPDYPFPSCDVAGDLVVCVTYPASDLEPGRLRAWRIR